MAKEDGPYESVVNSLMSLLDHEIDSMDKWLEKPKGRSTRKAALEIIHRKKAFRDILANLEALIITNITKDPQK